MVTGYSVDMLRQSRRFLVAAKEAGVRHIVHLGASGNRTEEVAHWGWHRLVESHVEQLGFAYTHVRPEAFMQNLTDFGWLRGDTLTSYIGDARWSWQDVADVGKMAAAALRDTDRFAGRTIPMGYQVGSLREVAEAMGDALGRSIRIEYRDADEFLKGALAAGADPSYMRCVADQFKPNAEGRINGADETFDDFEEWAGHAAVTWKEFAQGLSAATGQ